MPHADSSFIPSDITTREAFWEHVHESLAALLEGQRNWVSNLSNAASLIYNALLSFPSHFGHEERAVNWCGFYLESSLFPGASAKSTKPMLLLAPFSGKPACQLINAIAGKGVCADAYVRRATLRVPDVDAYPGHIACDGETKSEIVLPLITPNGRALGVMDLDCLALDGFQPEDAAGLEKIVELIVNACDWD